MLADDAVFANRYRILRKIAAGGMGIVYEARHLETERAVALKVMLPQCAESEPMRERFRQEARAAAKVSSAHVVEVLDAGVDEQTGSPFMVMELLRGEDLGKRVARLGALSVEEVCRVVEQTAKGLDALHRASIVHRDLKPSNLFVAEREGEAPRVKVLDLGVAKRVAETAGTTAAVGTPFYMAPEQLENGKITPQTDVFALGMVAYSLLAGAVYWEAEAKEATSTISLALTMLGGPTESASARAKARGVALPGAFDAWFAKATARASGERFSSALEAASALCEALGVARVEAAQPKADEPRQTAPASALSEMETKTLDVPMEPTIRSSTANKPALTRRAYVLSGLVLASIAVVSALLFTRRAPKPEEPQRPLSEPSAIASLVCPKAEKTTPSLAHIVEMGACARLAVELGVPFGSASGSLISAHFEPQEGGARVTLEVEGSRAEAIGATPMVAMTDAITALAPKLRVKAMEPAEIAAWGETDEASARRVQRVARRHAYGFARYKLADARALVETNPASPVAHLMLAYSLRREGGASAEESQAVKEKALGLLTRLPKGRATLVEGLLRTYVRGPVQAEVDQGIALLLKSYEVLAEDPDFAVLYTLCGFVVTDQTWPMVDRLVARDRIAALPLVFSMVRGLSEDPSRQERYLGLLQETLPEARSRYALDLVEMERVEEARAALAEARALGDPGVSKADLAEIEATIALAKLDGTAAIKAADEMFGEPNVEASYHGALLRLEALLLQGKVKDALSGFEREVARLRLLGHEDEANEVEERRQTLLGLTRQTKRSRADAQKRADEYRATVLPFLREKLAFDAALALESIGAADEASAAYRLAMGKPWGSGFEAIAARLRLARLARRAGKQDEAQLMEAIVDRVWSEADPGLRALVLQLS